MIVGVVVFVALFSVASMEHLPTRAGLSLLGGLAAYLAVSFDPPATPREAGLRAGVGIMTCFFFGPAVLACAANYMAYFNNPDGWVPVFGFVGLASWYVVGQMGKGLMWVQKSRLAEQAIRNRFERPTAETPPAKPEEK